VLRKSLFLKALEHKNLKGAATIHATSELEAEQILAFDPSLNVEIVPLGITDVLRPSDPTQTIDTNIDHVLTKSRSQAQIELKQQLSIDPSCPMLLFLARLHPKKGLERIVSALADTASLNTAHLLIAGSGEPQYERSLHHLCEQLGIAERVHFLGFLKEGQKRQALLGSDLYVLPSASENFGISVLEALNAGLPSLVSTGVALHDLVAKESLGGVIDLDAPSTNLGDSITLLLSSTDDLQAMGMKARRYTQEHYSWTSIATELKTIYARLIGLNKPS
jgi:glycosyltransferase involved in cell wall biosynthesis